MTGYTLVAKGGANELSRLGEYQNQFPEGSAGVVELNCIAPMAADVVSWLTDKLRAVGVPASDVRSEGSNVYIKFKTEIAPLTLIVGAIIASIVIVAIIIGWKLWKAGGGTLTTWFIIVPILIIAGTILVIVLMTRLGKKMIPD